MKKLYRMGTIWSVKKLETNYEMIDFYLSEEWMHNMRNKTKILWDLESIHIPWKNAHDNYIELKQYMYSHQKDLDVSHQVYLVSDEIQDALYKASQLVTNCIVSFTAFITISEIHIKKYYSNNLEVVKNWNDKRNSMHASSFSYRLSYELRNFSQHYSIPISGIEIHLRGGVSEKLKIFTGTDLLRRSGYDWKKLSTEKKFQEDTQLDMINVLEEYLHCVNELYKNTLVLHHERINECLDFFDKLIDNYQIDDKSHPVIFIGPSNRDGQPPENKEYIPLYIIKRFKRDWLRNLGRDDF